MSTELPEAETPCSACSWTPKRQKSCRYHSNVKLFYSCSDKGVWSLGSKFVLKQRSDRPPNFEVVNIDMLKGKTDIPVTEIVQAWTEDDGSCFTQSRRIPGEDLSSAWSTMSAEDRERVAKQTADYLGQLRSLHSPRIQSVDGQPVYSAFLFQAGYGRPHGPFLCDDELWGEMRKSLKGVPERVCQRLRECMPCATPYTFTHGDLTNVNILVDKGNLTGIIDWEAGGYFPVWWEYVCAAMGLSEEDFEWKTLLREYMPQHTDALKFWLDFRSLCKYPDVDERGSKLLSELDQ